MFIAGKPNYALLGRRQSYSIGNRQTKKDAIFQAALTTIHHYIDRPNFVFIPDLVAAIYRGNDPQLEPIRETLKSNSLFQLTTCLSASGNKILAYLAVLHDKNCLAENGAINLGYTKQIIRSFFTDETNGTIQFDDSAIRNLKATDTHFQFGKKRFAHLNLPFSRIDNIHTIQNRGQLAYQPQELEMSPLDPLPVQECASSSILVSANVPADQDTAIELITERLFQALAENNLSGAQEALCEGAKANALYKPLNITPLMWAVYNGWLDLAIDLLSKSSEDSINTVDKLGRTAIFIACQKLTDIPFLTQLLARSSDETINVVTRSGQTALLALVCKPLNHESAQQLLPLLMPRLTGINVRSAYKQPNIATAKTAGQIAHEHGPGPWADIARRIDEAMLALHDTDSLLNMNLAE